MFHVEADAPHNLLVQTFTQQVAPIQMRHCRVAIETALTQLSPGFRLLTDLSKLEKMDCACAKEISKIMDCNVGTVRSRLFYARQQMQGLMADYLR